MHGYAGKILEVDLSQQRIIKRDLSPAYARKYLGGIGFNAKILYDELVPGVDALDEGNILVFGVGAMVGSPFPTASRTEASAKSPMTGQYGTSNSGMFFGSQLKAAGFDALVIKGKAAKPVYLLIEDNKVEICDASGVWGKDSWEAIDILKSRHYGVEVALVGPAGENQVRFASIENGRYDGWGRTGLGAVMGSKKLKAVAVKGTKGVKPHDIKGILESTLKGHKMIKSASSYAPFTQYGTMNATIPYGRFKALAAHNFTQGTLPNWEENFGKQVVDVYSDRHMACQSCIVACAHWVEINEGKYKGLKLKDMEITPIVSYGGNCGLGTEGAVKATELCQRYGVDIVSSAGAIAFAIELFQKGIITREDVGFELNFGDDDAIFQLLQNIVERKGLGDILAEGTKRAAQHFEGAEKYAMHIKGLDIPMIDPRGRWSTWTLGMLTNIRGGDHLRCRNPVENLRYNENKFDYTKERFGLKPRALEKLDMPEGLKEKVFDLENDTVDIAEMSRWAEDLINLFNSLGVCIRPPVLEGLGPVVLAEAYTAHTGLEMTAGELMEGAERAWNLMKLFNLREGETIGDLKFPRRFYKEAVGDKTLDENKIQQVLRKYFEARGWDPDTSRPTSETLKRLELS
ncbi:MAG: aldehyde ferredoxin oxidoreductase family protein [Syntrophomonas sp.]